MNWHSHTSKSAPPAMAVRRTAGAPRFAIWRWLVPAWLVLPWLWMCLDGRAFGARHRLVAGGGEIEWARAPAEAARQRTGVLEHARRAKRVSLPPQALRGEGIRRADVLELRLFDETALAARVEQVAVDAAGTSVIRCRVDGYPLGFVVLTTHGGKCMAAIEVPELGLHHQLAYDPARGAHYLVDFGDRYPDTVAHAAPLQPPVAADAPQASDAPPAAPAGAAGSNDPATVDVMVVYTPEARAWADLHGGIGNIIAQALEKSQLAHDNSHTGITTRLVHAAEIAYTETGNSCTDLGRLQQRGDGYMDEIHSWRACYGADLVVLLTRMEDVGGIGFVLGCSAGSPDYGFSIARIQQVAGTFTMVHEMAHNMGCGHHKQQTLQPGPGLFPYAAGWRWVSPDGQRRCDLMTYPEGRYFADGVTHMAMPYFSSPVISYDGAVTGDPDHGDNRRCLMEVKHMVAAYQRAGPPNDSFANAETLSGAAGSATGCNIGASKESGEPNHAGNPGGKSLWWQWTAPASGWVAIDTTGSGFDTLLAVYSGDAVGVLAQIAPGGGGAPGRVTFQAVAGASYRIAVDGVDGADGKVTLNWSYPPQIVVTPGFLRVPEGGSATILVGLSAPPVANSTIVMIEVSGDPNLSVGTTKLVFSVTDWDTPRGVAVTAAQDADADDGAAMITCSAAGFASAAIAVTEGDDDTTLTLVAGVGGMVSPGGTVLVTKGEPVAIRAIADAGYEFFYWEVVGESATLGRADAAATTVALTASATVTANFGLYAEFARIPAGDFVMGRTGDDPDANAPPVTVETSAFLIGKHEVGKALWDEVRAWAAAHGYGDLATGGGKAPDHPVHSISWWDAVKWCNARSERDGLTPVYHVAGAVMRSGTTAPTAQRAADGYRLPTEAEWEKAARGGATGLRFPWGDTIDHHHANYRANHTAAPYDMSPYPVNTPHPDYNDGVPPYTAPVAAFWPNDYGLHGMAGNVMEWCWDWYGANAYVTGAADPQGPANGTYKVFRGGGWRSTAPETRTCYRRGYYTPGMAFNEIGFRLVRAASDDQGDTRMAAAMLVSGTPARGVLSDGDADCFAVAVPGPGLLICWTTGATDTTGEIRDGSGAVLASDHDLLHPGDLSILDANFRVSARVAAGAHFVQVTGAPGDYTLHAKFIPAGAPLEITLFRIISGGHVVLGLPTAAGTDYQLEWSSDLRNWTHLGRLAGTGGEVIAVLDRHAAIHPQRAVFRAYAGPPRPP